MWIDPLVLDTALLLAILAELFLLFYHVWRIQRYERKIDEHIEKVDKHVTKIDEHIKRLDEYLSKLNEGK
ncbi:MAG: hypothetical protein ACPLZC_02045 [Candidatus Bathyarchaeales archaeon]